MLLNFNRVEHCTAWSWFLLLPTIFSATLSWGPAARGRSRVGKLLHRRVGGRHFNPDTFRHPQGVTAVLDSKWV